METTRTLAPRRLCRAAVRVPACRPGFATGERSRAIAVRAVLAAPFPLAARRFDRRLRAISVVFFTDRGCCRRLVVECWIEPNCQPRQSIDRSMTWTASSPFFPRGTVAVPQPGKSTKPAVRARFNGARADDYDVFKKKLARRPHPTTVCSHLIPII
jgi:hypothetical protein